MRQLLTTAVLAALAAFITVEVVFADCTGCTSEQAMCGPRCLFVVCSRLGLAANLDEIAKLAGKNDRGTTLAGLHEAARRKGLRAVGVKIGLDELAALGIPAIAHLWQSHFVIVEGAGTEGFRVTDPPREPKLVPREQLAKAYSGFALLVADDDRHFPKTDTKKPDVRFDSFSCDLGSIDADHATSQTVRVRNAGNENLIISKVESSCPCVSPVSWPQTLSPGENGEIKLAFDPTGMTGEVEKTLHISSNDPIVPIAQLSVLSYVKSRTLRCLPDALYFGQLRRMESATGTIYVPSIPEDPIEIKGLMSESPFVVATVSPSADRERPGHLVTVKLKPGAPLGGLKCLLAIASNHARAPIAHVPVSAVIRGDIDLSSDSLFLGLVKKSSDEKTTLTISTVSSEPLKIDKIDCSLSYVSVSVAPKTEGKEYVLTATLKPDAPLGNIKGEVTIHTNNSDQPEIKVPVFAYIEER